MSNKLKLSEIIPYLICGFSVIVLIVCVVFLAYPAVMETINLQEKTTEAVNLVDNELKPKVAILTEQDPGVLDENFNLAITALPQELNSLALMNTLERIGKAYGVELNGISFAGSGSVNNTIPASSSSGSTGESSQQFSISTNSGYPTLMALLKSFETLLPLNSTSTVRFSKTQVSGSDISLSFTASFYYLPAVTADTGFALTGLTESEKQSLISIQQMKDYPLVPVYSDPGKDNPFQ